MIFFFFVKLKTNNCCFEDGKIVWIQSNNKLNVLIRSSNVITYLFVSGALLQVIYHEKSNKNDNDVVIHCIYSTILGLSDFLRLYKLL